MKTLLSEDLQWDILDTLAEIHPRALTQDEFNQEFGDVSDNEMLVNVIQLVDDGLIQPRAIKRTKRPNINTGQLLLTPAGYRIATSAPPQMN